MAQRIELKDTMTEMRIFSARLVVTAAVVVLLTGVLAFRYFTLQVVNHEQYRTQSDNNRIHVQSIAPKRGLIFDRNGELLAENRPSYTLTLVPERIEDMTETLLRLDGLLGIGDEEIERFRTQLRRHRPFEAVPLRFKLTEAEIALLASHRHRLPGVEVEAQLLRHYVHGDLFAHVIGYVGRINEQELRDLDPVNYAASHHVGKTGVERVYEDLLHGSVGSRQVETNAWGKVLRTLGHVDPQPGRDLTLTIDRRLQQVAFEAFGEERGALVAVDPVSGGVLALVSTPSFDPNLFVQGISTADYEPLRDSPYRPLFNRALQGQYPPASTIKPLFALAGLELGFVDEHHSVPDPGFYRLPGDERLYRDWKRSGHGARVALDQAIVESCDVYFYDLAHRMGIERLHDFSARFGLGEATGIDQTGERPGLLPSDEWKRRTRGMVWFPGETLSVGIGQGYLLSTPVQLAMMTATLATHGHRVRPHLLMRVGDEVVPQHTLPTVELGAERHWHLVQTAMENVVHTEKGTASLIADGASYRMAGKTGTAQVIGIPQGAEYDEELVDKFERDHALFVGYAPAENPQIAVAVVVENGGHGSSVAAPIVRKVFDAWLAARPGTHSLPPERL
jgi:penicillin-binding protein 2